MTQHTLKAQSADGTPLEATFDADGGMNLVSFKRGNTEVIAQSTRPLFEQRKAGLGALIGPHFHRRNPNILPPAPADDLFPHIASEKSRGGDLFSHGIARYVPWNASSDGSTIHATLSGKDEWKGVPLSEIEGQDFNMELDAELTSEGLDLHLSIRSATDSLVGIHYYYDLPQNSGRVTSRVKPYVRIDGELSALSEEWTSGSRYDLAFDLRNSADYGFQPEDNGCGTEILLDAGTYKLRTRYSCPSTENCWQLWRPEGQSFVCIEPMSAANPRKPQLTVSQISINLQVLDS